MVRVTLLFYTFLILMMSSCNTETPSDSLLLSHAKDIMKDDPKQAFILFDSILSPKEMGQELYMQYLVTSVEIKRKNGLSIIGDTLIFTAQEYFNQNNEPIQAADANYMAGAVCYETKDWKRAITCFQKALQYAFQTDNNLMMAKSNHSLGLIFYNNGLLDSAIVSFNQSLGYYNKISNVDIQKMQVLTYVGFIYDDMSDFDKAEYYFRQSFDIANQAENKLYQGYGNQNLGLVCLDRKNYNEALAYFNKALPNMVNSVDSIRIYINMSKLYTETRQLDSAAYYTSIIKKTLPQMTDNRMLAYTYSVLKDYYGKEHDFEKALQYSILCDSVHQVINNHDLIAQLNEAGRKQEIALMQEKMNSRQKMMTTWSIASYIILFLLFLNIFIYCKMRSKLKKYQLENSGKGTEVTETKDPYFSLKTDSPSKNKSVRGSMYATTHRNGRCG